MADEREQLCKMLGFESAVVLHKYIVQALQSDFGALARRGLNAKTLLELGYVPEGLRKLGCSDAQLAELGFAEKARTKSPPGTGMPSDAPLGADEIMALVRKGTDSADLRKMGITAHHCRNAGADVTQLLRLGFSMGELAQVYTLQELKRFGNQVRDLSPYFGDSELKAAGFSATEMRIAGRSIRQLLALGYNENHIRTAGYSINDLSAAGLSRFTKDHLKGQ